jgi:isopentenyl phosphate kinase
VILAGHVEGVFTADPLREKGTRLVEEISLASLSDLEARLTGSPDTDVTGGMLAKVRTMCQMIEAKPTLTVRIISGLKGGVIRDVLIDPGTKEGTLLRR